MPQTEEYMPRPVRKRTIYQKPKYCRFRPDHETEEEVNLTLDELEAVRLSDLIHLDQSEGAERMNIARTTFQKILNSAHEKIADALVNGKTLEIEGGNVLLEDDPIYGCCSDRTIAKVGSVKELGGKKNMKIAAAYDPETGEIFQHFGRTEYFKVYDIENNQVVNAEVRGTNGQGHGALAGVLASLGAEVLICGGIGAGAQNALAAAGIRFYGGCAGSADEAVKAYLSGNLNYQEDVQCNHHDHEGGCGHEGGSCCH